MRTRTDYLNQINDWKDKGQVVVFTNGCYDILHRGHVDYLEAARQEGDRLVVGLNSDSSVRKIKGDDRPIQNEDDRMAILTALRCVDMVILFNKSTPASLIHEVAPDVLVKGGDYTEEEIVGSESVKSNGGKVVIIPFVEGASTTNIITRILSSK